MGRGCTAVGVVRISENLFSKLSRLRRYSIRVSLTLQHGTVGGISNGEDVRWYFVSFDALISFHNLFGINR